MADSSITAEVRNSPRTTHIWRRAVTICFQRRNSTLAATGLEMIARWEQMWEDE